VPVGKSLHIGVNRVNPAAYGGWDGPLNACEYDAADMALLAGGEGFHTKTLLTAQATRVAVDQNIRVAAQTLVPGDIFLITYSGHGGQVPDKNNDEDDFLDETWCLYDGQLIDDQLLDLWSLFQEDVRIVVISDSCHSGTVAKLAGFRPEPLNIKSMPIDITHRAYQADQSKLEAVLSVHTKARYTEDEIDASVLQISGCQDNQFSYDGAFNGAFTAALLRAWNQGSFRGSWKSFHKQISKTLPDYQQPNLLSFGGRSFVNQAPFRI